MFSRTYLAISGAKVARAVVYMVSPLCRPVNAWAVNLFLPNLGFGRLVRALRAPTCPADSMRCPKTDPPRIF
jgi:hypothetical protein